MPKSDGESLIKKFTTDFFSYGALEAISKTVNFLLLPILTRHLTVEEYGILDLIYAGIALSSSVCGLALRNSLNRYYKPEGGEKGIFLTHIVLTGAFSMMVGSILFANASSISHLLVSDGRYSDYIMVGVVSSMFSAFSALPLVILRRRRKVFLFGFVNLFSTLLYIGFAVASISFMDLGIIGIFYGHALANIFKAIISLALTSKDLFFIIEWKNSYKYFKFSLPLFPRTINVWANSQLNRFIILFFLGEMGLGIFGAGLRVSNLVNYGAAIFRRTWMPFSMDLIQSDSDLSIYKKVFDYYFTAYSIFVLIFNAVSPLLVAVILPEKYSSSFYVIPWLSVAFMIQYSSGILNMGTMISEKTFINTLSTGLALIVNLAVSILLIEKMGIVSVALGSMMSQLVSRTFLMYQSEKILNINFNKKSFWLLMLFMVIHVLIVSIGYFYFQDETLMLIGMNIAMSIPFIYLINFHVFEHSSLKLMISKWRSWSNR